MYQACPALLHSWCRPGMTVWWRCSKPKTLPKNVRPRDAVAAAAFGCRFDLTHVRVLIDKRYVRKGLTLLGQDRDMPTLRRRSAVGDESTTHPLIDFATSKPYFSPALVRFTE